MNSRREAMILFGGGVALVCSAGGSWARTAGGAPGSREDGLTRANPVQVGVDPDAVIGFLEEMAASGLELNSFMLFRKGAVAAEGWFWPYRADIYHMLHSSTKSFVGAGVGIAVDEGLINLSDPVLEYFPDRVTAPSANLQAMTVEHLLTQTSGHAIGISGSQWRPIKTSWVTEFLKVPVSHPPGAHFAYSSATSFMLSAIVTQASGMSLSDYLRPRLFGPMDINNYHWDMGPENINPGGNGLSTTTADFLKLGVMMLHRGRWKGRQIVSADWAAASGKPTHGNNYGYQWWVSPNDLGYYAAGKFGQFTFVFPRHDAVLTITAGVADNLATRKKMHAMAFKHIGPMCGASNAVGGASERLSQVLSELRTLPVLTDGQSSLVGQVSGRLFRCADNPDSVTAIRVTFVKDRAVFEMHDGRGRHIVTNGLGCYREETSTITGSYLHHEYQPERMRVFAGGHWIAEDKFEMIWQFVETGFRDTATLTFKGDHVTYDRSVNVNSGPLSRPSVFGKIGTI